MSCFNARRDFHPKPYMDLSIVQLDNISIYCSNSVSASPESTELVIHASSPFSLCCIACSIDVS